MAERRLIIMRHATALGSGARDFDRHLSERGTREARAVGRRLVALGAIPGRVLCSSAMRCRETWQGVALALAPAAPVDFEDDLYGASAATIRDVVTGIEDAETLMILAHNPGVSVLAHELGSDRDDDSAQFQGGFTPASIAIFAVADAWPLLSRRTARLLHFEAPSGT